MKARMAARPVALPPDAALAAALLAVDPAGLGGVALRAAAGPLRDAWLALLRSLLPAAAPWRRVPLHINDERLLGGLDLGATLQSGRPVAQRGVLAEADGGVLLLAMAERLPQATVARITAAQDSGEVVVERDGIGSRRAARFGVVALDEGIAVDERLPSSLLDRLAFPIVLDEAAARRSAADAADATALATAAEVAQAAARLPQLVVGDEIVQSLCGAALALGVASLRASLHAVRAACALAALAGRDEVDEQDAAAAARLVLAPRATRVPAAPPEAAEAADEADDGGADTPAPPPPPDADDTPPPEPESEDAVGGEMEERVLEAAIAAIPPGLLAALKLGQMVRARSASSGRAGALQQGRLRGRPSGVRAGEPRGGARLNLLETLRAAAPWQGVRRREEANGKACFDAGISPPSLPSPFVGEGAIPVPPRLLIRHEDFRVTRFKQRSVTTTIFAVDASGSAALARLAEAKGAVELLLADCYVRRDQVALLAFRGQTAELLLPPTRSLVRAKRSLAALPGGGGTPLAAGIDAAAALADAVRRRGETPIVVLLTDGRANIARDGAPGRARAGEDALAAARALRAAGFSALLLDTSAQPQPSSQTLAREMGAVYLALPYAGAAGMSQAVQAVNAARLAAG